MTFIGLTLLRFTSSRKLQETLNSILSTLQFARLDFYRPLSIEDRASRTAEIWERTPRRLFHLEAINQMQEIYNFAFILQLAEEKELWSR